MRNVTTEERISEDGWLVKPSHHVDSVNLHVDLDTTPTRVYTERDIRLNALFGFIAGVAVSALFAFVVWAVWMGASG